MKRATGSPRKNIVCKNCAHQKHWHNDRGCFIEAYGVNICDCEGWEYGTNIEDDDSEEPT